MKMIAAACAVLMLSACATQEVQEGPTEAELIANAGNTGNTAGQGGHQMTGSRLKRDSTERMLKAVGAQGARDEMNNAPRPLDSR